MPSKNVMEICLQKCTLLSVLLVDVCICQDILITLPRLLATCTATFGSVLKIDSTKKVCGIAAGSASWCTNVGNERGEMLNIVSVLTESEGLEGL